MPGLDRIQSLLKDELIRMNDIIHSSLATPNELMNSIVENYLKTKGKQIRPILVLLSANMFGGAGPDALYAGASLEMLHNASLIHDDIVDETKLRRGNPTINSMWGNHIAVLTGDFFVSNSLAAAIKTGHLSIIKSISELGVELSLGEIDQICNARDHHFDEEHYFSVIRKKTASLFMSCIRMGAESVNASEEEFGPLVRYGELLGLCFQIKDDIFDYFDSKEIGKPTGNDLLEGKVTLPLLHALKTAPESEAEKMKSLLRRGELDAAEIETLQKFARDNGGIDYAFEKMRSMQQEGEKLLGQYPDSRWKDCFSEIFEFIISRHN